MCSVAKRPDAPKHARITWGDIARFYATKWRTESWLNKPSHHPSRRKNALGAGPTRGRIPGRRRTKNTVHGPSFWGTDRMRWAGICLVALVMGLLFLAAHLSTKGI